MFSKFWPKVLIVLSIFAAFILVYQLLEKKEVYNSTLGKITTNYQKTDTGGGSMVKDANIPFKKFEEKNADNWDAKFYKSIRDSLYSSSSVKVIYRYAFYPFFPLVWKASHTNIHGIVFLNYLFFGLSLILLSSIFLKGNKSEMFYFLLALLLPISIVFYLPYTEALFMLTFSIAAIGLVKKKYWLFFIGIVLCSMTRPSSLILAAAFIVISTMNFFYHRKILLFLKDFFLIMLPVFFGWLAVILIQYYYSASWSTYIIASSFWPNEPDLYKKVTDWSMEGFGMTTFAIFAFIIPICIYVTVWGMSSFLGKEKENRTSIFRGDEQYTKRLLFNISTVFLFGSILLNMRTSGYQLHGIYRYSMATPFFFIILFQLPEKFKSITLEYKLSGFLVVLACITLFLLSAEYAGDIFRFKYLGLYLLLIMLFFVVIEPHVSGRIMLILLLLIIIPCLIWHTYLFNMYLGDAWIFT